MNPGPLVTVLVPARNAAATIDEALQSVLGQDLREIEVLVSDDASEDGTAGRVAAVAARDPRVRLLGNPVRLGIAANRNRLLAEARAPYVAWLDADDIALPGRLRRQYEFLETHPRVVIVGGEILFFDGADGRVVEHRRYRPDDAALRRAIFRYSPVSQGAAMARRAAVLSCGGFDVGLPQVEDLDLSFRLGLAGEFANLQEPVLRCRVHGGSVSQSRLRENIRCTLFVRRRARRRLGYRMGMLDRLAQAATRASLLLPTGLVRRLFAWLRSSGGPHDTRSPAG